MIHTIRKTASALGHLSAFISGALLLLLATAPCDAQAPQITGLSAPSLPRSGLLEISGTNFGAEQGTSVVLIDGVSALATTWTDTDVHAYVPEQAGPGLVSVTVQTSAGSSNAPLLNVTLRAADGRVRWTFEMDSTISGSWSAAGPDGTVYATDDQRMYALSDDGALLWTLEGGGGGMPIVFGEDGTLYTGQDGVVAINPDGSLKWEFLFPTSPEVIGGPGVGPDGNIYALDNSLLGGHGAFALDPDGNLLWESFGPSSTTGSSHKLIFDDDRFYAPYNADAAGGLSLRAYDYDGDELWSASGLQLALGSRPVLDAVGQLITSWGMNGVQALSKDGGVVWKFQPDELDGLVVPPTVGPDGTIYVGTWISGDLWAANSDGSTKWAVENMIAGSLGNMSVTPDNTTLLDGGSPGFGSSSFLRAFSTVDGAPLWQVDFQPVGAVNQYAWWSEPGYSPGADSAYVTTRWAGNARHGLLYAVDITPTGAWVPLGHALAGTHGEPSATGTGTPIGGESVTLALSGARENSTAHLVVATSQLNAPFKGGVLVPDVATGLVVPLSTGPTGALQLTGDWPHGLPAGTTVSLQWWIQDAAGPFGFSASNGLSATTP